MLINSIFYSLVNYIDGQSVDEVLLEGITYKKG